MKSKAFGFAVVCLALSTSASVQAQEDDAAEKKACQQAYVSAQDAKQNNELVAARKELLICAQDACTDFIKQDCVKWLEEVEASMPSVVLAVKDADGNDVLDGSVFIDGEKVADKLDGAAIKLDPGPRTIVIERNGERVEKKVLLRQGERNRRIDIKFGGGKEQGAAPPPDDTKPPADEKPPEEETEESGGTSPFAYVFTGLGVVGVGMFAVFGLQGKSDESDLDKTCSPACPEKDVDEVRSKYLLADIGLGVGVVSLGIAAILFASGGGSDDGAGDSAQARKRIHVDLVPTKRGGFATLGGRF